ncbi:SpoIIE family protein phosphatase [Ancylothrix sp. C2]|uniref:SpoIIE family protein phosphatase n=1 Tax=Ancylothrix sp. D3o TaxID=2953691 RepID=UPI0021BA5B11|nr:SpoIIE family protein phosphatase [Ancylothrix sp. D3o]MCT7950263.1 SpoIIE family protein phosphatase [Ancylothrix sp. D3o]
MSQTPLPSKEALRIEALRHYHILDTAPEPAFDDLVRLAAQICSTPTAQISLIDTDRQWLKAKFGWSKGCMRRQFAFCAHGILCNGLFIVGDALQDSRFAAHPLVIGPPYIRFYAGVPLMTGDGLALGMLCVIDYKPRELSLEQQEMLQTLGRQVMTLMESRRQLRQMETTQAHLHNFLDRANVLIQSVRLSDGKLMSVNQTWRCTLGYSDAEIDEMWLWDVLHPESRQLWLLEKLRQGQAIEGIELIFLSKNGDAVWVEGNIDCRVEAGQPLSRWIFRNVTSRKYRQIFERSDEGLFQVTLDGRFCTANAALARIFGYDSPEQFLQCVENIGQLYAETNLWKKCLQQLEIEKELRQEEVMAWRNGSEIWVSQTLVLRQDVNGRSVGVEGFVRDVTTRKQSEVTIQMAKELLQTVLDAVPGAVSLISSNFRYLGVNRHLATIYNMPQEDFVNREVGFHQSKFGQFVRDFFASSASEASLEIDAEVEGSPSHAVLAKKWNWLGDEAAVFVGIDITQRKLAEAALQAELEERERIQAALEAELEEAAKYVRSLLPAPMRGPVGIDWLFLPSKKLGGDSFGYDWLDRDHLAIYLIDVSGHGLGSALLSVSVLNLLRSGSGLQTNYYWPSDVLEALNQTFQMDKHGNMYLTIWYGVYNRLTNRLIYASAGHPPAVLISENQGEKGKLQELRSPGCLPIGMLPNVEYTNAECEVEPGSTLYIFSDGIYEFPHPDGRIWSFDIFINWLGSRCLENEINLDEFLSEVRSANGKDTFDDDVSWLQISF